MTVYFPSSHAQSLEEKIGQMIMLGLPTSQAAKDTMIYDIQNRNLGGILMFAYNISSPSQIRALNYELQLYAETPLFISVDQEGGIVARLDEQNGYRETYSNYTLGYEFNSEDSTRAQAQLMSHWLSEAGFTVNLAPVVDLNINSQSPAIGKLKRSFSDDAYKVYEHASWFSDEFHKNHITTALKHYPGHGSAVDDSHNGFTDITSTWLDKELDPYAFLINNGYRDMVMTGHLFKADWDSVYPTSLSYNAITTILRDSLGFEGVVISDELFMKAIKNNYGFDEAVIQTIKAGTDILLFSTNLYQDQSLTAYIIKLISTEINDGNLDSELIDLAYNRIRALKNRRVIASVDKLTQSGPDLPNSIEIQNYPNPFNPATTITLSLTTNREVSVKVYNSLGGLVYDYGKHFFSSGLHKLDFNGKHLSSGIYFVSVSNGKEQFLHKMVLIK